MLRVGRCTIEVREHTAQEVDAVARGPEVPVERLPYVSRTCSFCHSLQRLCQLLLDIQGVDQLIYDPVIKRLALRTLEGWAVRLRLCGENGWDSHAGYSAKSVTLFCPSMRPILFADGVPFFDRLDKGVGLHLAHEGLFNRATWWRSLRGAQREQHEALGGEGHEGHKQTF